MLDVFDCCLVSGGSKARNAKKLHGLIVDDSERPDLVIELDNGGIIGLEHFRIDHFIRGDKKAQSKSAPFARNLEERRKKVASRIGEEDFIDKASKLVGEASTQALYDVSHATYADFVRSFEKRLIDERLGHLPKVEFYRDRLAESYPAEARIELGFLIEVHSNFQGLFFHDGAVPVQLGPGQCPLFEEVYNMLLEAAPRLDWILLAFYPSVGSDIVDAAVIDCRNGMFKESCRRQGLRMTTSVARTDAAWEVDRARPEAPKIIFKDDYINFFIDGGCRAYDFQKLMLASCRDAAQAFNLEREGLPFTLTLSAEMVFETLHADLYWRKGNLCAADVANRLFAMNPDKRDSKFDAFADRWGIDKSE